MIVASEDRYRLLVSDLETQKFEFVGFRGDKDVFRFNWLDDKRLMFGVGSLKLYSLGLFATEVGELQRPYPLLQNCGASLISVPKRNRLRPLVWIRHDIDQRRDAGVAVINTDIKTGRAVNLATAGASYSELMDSRDNNDRHVVSSYPLPKGGLGFGYMADKDGELAFAYTSDEGVLALHRLAGKTWEKCPIDLDLVDVVDCGNDPGQLVALESLQPGRPRALRFMDAATGEFKDSLFTDEGYDFGGWLYRDPGSRKIVGAVYDRAGPHVVWFDESYRAIQKILDSYFPGLVVRILGSDDAGKVFLISARSDRQPAIYHWVNLEKRSIGLIKNSMPWIDPSRMQPMSIMKFKTRDGRQLDAYVTLPAGTSKKNPAPLVVLPHGGPWARDGWGFDSEAQFLASRGYAVMQPNYRGSTGYNWMFPEEDQWAFRKMHDDVTDATKVLLRSGMIAADRVAIMGGSFGAYLALSGVVHEPELFRCAVTIAGVFDWEQLVKERKYDQFRDPQYGRLLRKLGDPTQHKDRFEQISPVRYVKNIRVPLFVSHGGHDPVAEIGQSRRLISELKKYNVSYETYLVGDEGHGMGYLKNRVELYARVEAFLAKHLAPQQQVATLP